MRPGITVVNADSVFAEFFCHSDGFGGDGGFCAGVNSGAVASAVVAGDGADVDDAALAFFKPGQSGLGYEENRADVCLVDVIVVFDCRGFEGLAVDEVACVVDEDVDAALRLWRIV